MSRKRQTELSILLNSKQYRYYIDRLNELAISSFKWEGLPDTCNSRYLECSLFSKGIAVFFKEDVTHNFLSLSVEGTGSLDIYGEWSSYYAYSVNNAYKSRVLNPNDSVLIYNNMLHKNTFPMAEMYARKLTQIDRTIDINVKNTRQPKIILCDEKQRLSMENLIAQYDGGYNNIFADKALNLDTIKVIDLSAPYLCDKLQELKIQLWNEALTYLGISNSTVNKQERMVTDEVLQNQGGIFASRNSRLYERQHAADKINKMFGLNISVDFNDTFNAELQEKLPEDNKNYESIHNTD